MAAPFSDLPDDLCLRIFAAPDLSPRDLCSIAIAARRLRRLSSDPFLWEALLSRDFPSFPLPPTAAHPKETYKKAFELDRVRREAVYRRRVQEAMMKVAASRRRADRLAAQAANEAQRLQSTSEEVARLLSVRRASIALNVWQPQVVRGHQKQLVEQCSVPVESRLATLQMELRVCKQQLTILRNSHTAELKRLREYEEALTNIGYHPLQNYQFCHERGESSKRKKPRISDCEASCHQEPDSAKDSAQ